MMTKRIDFQEIKIRLNKINEQISNHQNNSEIYNQRLKERENKFNERFLTESTAGNEISENPYLFFLINNHKYILELSMTNGEKTQNLACSLAEHQM